MVAIISLLVTVVIALTIVRVATVALTLTGLSREAAKFQARSAFTGVGYTTSESEGIVNHPVRRRIVMLLMLLGNAGIVAAATTLILSFAGSHTTEYRWVVAATLIIGIAVILFASSSRWLERRMTRVIEWALRKWTTINVRDDSALLRLAEGYGIAESFIEEGDWMDGKTLAELDLRERGILVLGVRRPSGEYEGGPRGTTRLGARDVMIIYGRGEKIQSVCGRTTR